ncbi:MAG: hypothetical protein FWE24_03260 [Defluviitaleaceae bacterium]|nr:hypothetical protein [Defluviitaleaceae bacterium]
MEKFFKEVLSGILENEDIQVIFPNLDMSAAKILVEAKSFGALYKIKTIIENDSLSDYQCIEEIICILESIGSNGGNRHDF